MSRPRKLTLPESFDECKFEEFEARPDKRLRLHCECGDPANYFAPDAGRVFRCRDEEGFSCGRYCCACVGGGDDNRCPYCWCKREHAQGRLSDSEWRSIQREHGRSAA